MVRHLCQRLAVLYLGKVVEQGDTARIFGQPQHPYTLALLAAAPRLQGGVPPALLVGEVPSASAMPPGCRFRPRCPEAQVAACRTELPPLLAVDAGHFCACHLKAPGFASGRDALSTA